MDQHRAEKDLEAMRKASKKILASKESAREYLIKYGFLSEDLQLTEQYGGTGKSVGKDWKPMKNKP